MPLHGKIVVIKKNGVDGVEFPLTASCLFGRKPDSDIRIQIPQVSKEHCRIDLNENKEVILTNLSKANPTRINGDVLTQSERLKHGDTITIVDRSFRFEYPPAPTPKKRSSSGGKTETLKVRQDQQVSAAVCVGPADKRTSEVTTGAHLKDGARHDNIKQSLETTLEMEFTKAGHEQEGKKNSPFSDLYHMIKQSLEIKTPCKPAASQSQTPSSKFCTPKPASVRKSTDKPATPTPKKDQPNASGTPQTAKKQTKTAQVPAADEAEPRAEEPNARSEGPSPKRRSSVAPQKFTALEIIEQISAQTSKSPARRRSKEATPTRAEATGHQDQQEVKSPKAKSPGRASAGNRDAATKKRKSGELGKDRASPQKRKRVSFGGQLSPELFDKRLPPNSPLRKGATPRRSLVVFKPKSTLLRRASVIGLIKEQSPAKGKTPSPKKPKAGSPAKKSPKSGSATPKTASPAQKSPRSKPATPKAAPLTEKSPKSRTASPKTASPGQKSPKSKPATPKAASVAEKSPKSMSASPKTPAQKSPKSRTPSSKTKSLSEASPKTPLNSGGQAPTVQGRFSVSRISTPSPTAEAVADQEPVSTPKIPIKRKSMKSSARKTPRAARSAVKLLQRRSGASRVSMKALTSWAGIVKFGKIKPQVVVPSKKKIPQKIKKKAAKCKPQTPARVPKGHMSTGHADSPATIVVGRAHKKAVTVGAAPRVVTNTVLVKKNMKMDEDLTGISEMFKTPVAERKRRSLTNDDKEAVKTPGDGLSASVMESVLSTPEESGEMIVSPLSVTSAVKSRRYNSEAVQRLLDGENTTVETAADTTPKQKAPKPECLTGIKRIMKTPKQKPEPLEDLRGKILKTPKQKVQQQECLTGVKRIMKTPKQKPEPLEDLRGKILKTPKQKLEQQECLTGVKRIMKTPKHKAEPLEDLRGKLLITPKQKPEPQECLTGVKRIFMTPKQKADEDLGGKLSMTPKVEVSDVSLDGVKEHLKSPTNEEKRNTQTPPPTAAAKKTPRKKNSPVQDLVGVKRLLRTPKEKGKPVEEKFGIKRLMKSPRLRGNPPVEDFEGLQELMEEPPRDEQEEESMECAAQTTTEPDGADDEINSEMLNKSSIDEPSEAADSLPLVDANVPQQPEADQINADKVTKVDSSEKNKKSNRSRPKAAESEEVVDRNEAPEETAPILSARGRRAKKTEATAPAVRPRRGRNAKILEEESTLEAVKANSKRGQNDKEVTEDIVTTENQEVDHQETSEMISKTKRAPVRAKRGRNTKHEEEGVSEVSQNTTESQQTVVEEKSEEIVVPDQEEPVFVEAEPSKPRRGVRKAKQEASTEVLDVLSDSTNKPVRGRRGKQVVEDVRPAENQELVPKSENQETVCKTKGAKAVQNKAPVRAKRGRNAKHEEVDEVSPDLTDSQQAVVEEKPNESEGTVASNKEQPPAEPSKPRRGGRKAKQEASTEVLDVLSDSTNKPVRGRRGKRVVEDVRPAENQELVPKSENQETVCKTKGAKAVQNKAPVRAKRGRNAKHEEVDKVSPDLTDSQQAVVEEKPNESEGIVASNQEEPPAEPSKPRRGGKAKQDTESLTSTGEQEVTSVSSKKPVRGRREKPVREDTVTAEPEHQETEEKATKPSRAKRAAKNEVPKAAPAKRARRGAAPPAEVEEDALSVPQVAEPKAKRGRRAAAKQTPEEVSGDQTIPDKEERRKPVRSVKWNADLEVIEIPKATPVKAARGKKSTQTKNPSSVADAVQKEELSGEGLPAKRGRRGVQGADGTAPSTSNSGLKENVPQPKTRRGRQAKK